MTQVVVQRACARSRASCASSRAGIAADDCDFPPASRFVRRRTVCGKPCSTGCSRASTSARVLDLFAGSGALGLEALSRGAAQVTFVEKDRRAAAAIEAVAREWQEGERVGGMRGCARAGWRSRADEPPFDIVFLDPPYDSDLLARGRALALGRQARARRAHLPGTARARPAAGAAGGLERASRGAGRRGRVSSVRHMKRSAVYPGTFDPDHQRTPGPGAPRRERVRTRHRRDRLEP